MNKKGQSLVEFVIILPIIMMLIFVIIDFANVFYQKNHLESITNDIVDYKLNGKTDSEIENVIKEKIKISTKKDMDKLNIEVTKDINLVTPFSTMFFKNPYTIKCERIVLYEQ